MGTRRMFVRVGQEPTAAQIENIRKADAMPITFDEDCPELTDEQYEEFARIAAQQRAERAKERVSLRLSPETLERAKKWGRGYTSVLSRLLDLAVKDPAMVQKCLS